jgi:hypothetical protein
VTPSEPLASRAPTSAKPVQVLVSSDDSDERARLMNLLARACGAESSAQALAYGCVDWYLYAAETAAPATC